MGGGRSPSCGSTVVVVVVMMLITILCSSHSCRGSALIKANTTYGGVMTAEFLIYRDITRYLGFEGAQAKTGKTEDKNVEACGNGKGNSFSGCGGSTSNTKQCNAYHGPEACK